MLTRSPLLLEIGTEELPSSFVDAALVALPRIIGDELAKARLEHGEIRPLGTPRRLAVHVAHVATRQSDLDEEVIGPPEAAAFKDGQPTKAAQAFAAKVGAAVESLFVVERAAGPKQKPGRYVVARRVEQGRPAMALLAGALVATCAAIPFRKSMRWGNLEVAFGRPVHWLVALLGDEVIGLEFAGVRSGRRSRGHRFLSPDEFDVRHPDAYVAELMERHVVVDRRERHRLTLARVEAAARALGGVHDPEVSLLDENVSLVEEPHVVTGSFDPNLLELPAAVIRAVARGHQKYFTVETSGDELLPNYLAVVNTANRPDLIRTGTDRVMRARLADARFFWLEDRKTPLGRRLDKLAGIVFHARLGTVREKVTRIVALGQRIAQGLGLGAKDLDAVERAALLCKCDLVTLMVGEFPELQGHMGRAYALAENEPRAVADAIRDHYRPVGAQDDVAPGDVAAVVALADRIDTLAGCFAIGLAPTSTADPFALRRAAIGALRTMIDRDYTALVFADLVAAAYDGFGFAATLEPSREDATDKLLEFAAERLRGLVATLTSNSVADAVLAGTPRDALGTVVAVVARARALQAVVDAHEPWLDKAKTVAKRLAGISREAQPHLYDASAFRGSAKPDDQAIEKLVRDLHEATQSLTSEQTVRQALLRTERISVELERIFSETLVNDPNDSFTPARLQVLAHGARSMLRIADFSRLT